MTSSILEIFADDHELHVNSNYLSVAFPPDSDLSRLTGVAVTAVNFLHTVPNVRKDYSDFLDVSYDGGTTYVRVSITPMWYDMHQLMHEITDMITAYSPTGEHVVDVLLTPNRHVVLRLNATAPTPVLIKWSQLMDMLGFDVRDGTRGMSPGGYIIAPRIPDLSGIRKILLVCPQLSTQTSILRNGGMSVIASVPVNVTYGSVLDWEALNVLPIGQGRASGNIQTNLTFYILDEAGNNVLPFIDHSFSITLRLYR